MLHRLRQPASHQVCRALLRRLVGQARGQGLHLQLHKLLLVPGQLTPASYALPAPCWTWTASLHVVLELSRK